MNFNSRVAKLGKGKFVNGYARSGEAIEIYLNNRGLTKKLLVDSDGVFELQLTDFANGNSEIIKLANNLYVQRVFGNVLIKETEE